VVYEVSKSDITLLQDKEIKWCSERNTIVLLMRLRKQGMTGEKIVFLNSTSLNNNVILYKLTEGKDNFFVIHDEIYNKGGVVHDNIGRVVTIANTIINTVLDTIKHTFNVDRVEYEPGNMELNIYYPNAAIQPMFDTLSLEDYIGKFLKTTINGTNYYPMTIFGQVNIGKKWTIKYTDILDMFYGEISKEFHEVKKSSRAGKICTG